MAADVQALFRDYIRLDRKRRDDALTPAEMERWRELKRRLNATFSPPSRPEHEERRESVRVPVRLRVRFRSAGELRSCLLTNLSRGGVFVNTLEPLPIGSQVLLRIELADTRTEIEAPGEVVSHNVGPQFEVPRQGMGVRFGELAPEAREALQRYYERALGPD